MTRSLYHLPFVLLFSAPLHAQEWTGAVDSDWNNAANWTDWPLSGEDLTVDPANYTGAMAAPVVATGATFVPDRLFVQNGATLAIAAALTVADRMIIADDAQVVMTAGSLLSDRLIMETGGTFGLDAGTITTGRLVLGDDGTQPSRFDQNGGTTTVTGEFGFDVAVTASAPVCAVHGGMLTVNTDAVWLGVAPGSGAGRLEVHGGTMQVNGSLGNTNNSTIDLRVALTGGTLVVNGATLDLAHATDSLVMTGGELGLDNALVVHNAGRVYGTAGVTRVLDQTELRGTGGYRFHHMMIEAGATLQHTGPAEMAVSGDWMNAGTFAAQQNTVAFVGDTAQTVTATAFHGLRIANTGGGVVPGPGNTTVAGALVLDNGLVHTDPTAMVTLLQGATATSGSAQSHVAGPLRKVGNDDFVFPVGQDGLWRRIGVEELNDQDTELTATYFPTHHADTTTLDAGLAAVSTTEHWTLTRAVTTDAARVTLYWEDAAWSDLGDCSALDVAYWNGVSWSGAVGQTLGSCQGNDAGTVQSDDAIPVFAAFTFGTSDGTIGVEELRPVDLPAHPSPADTWTMVPALAPDAHLFVYDADGREMAVPVVRQGDHLRMATDGLPAGLYQLVQWSEGRPLGKGRVLVMR